MEGSSGKNGSNNTCVYQPAEFLMEKFVLITVFGTIVCAVGIFNNSLLVYLLTRRSLIGSPVFYLAVLAGCDIIVEIAYFLLMSMQILYDYAQSLILYYAWNNYLRPIFAISHVSMTVSTYTIVAASAERYLTSTTRMTRSCVPKDRLLAIVFVLCFSTLTKGMVYWELDVVHNPHCSGFESYAVLPSSLASRPGPYKYIYMLWFRQMVHVFLPFVLLIVLNVGILMRLKKTPVEVQAAFLQLTVIPHLSSYLPKEDVAERKKENVRAATRMLVAIVTTYLISNLLNVIITIWEHLDIESLRSQERFYAFFSDTVSLLTVVTSAIRLPIYCFCNKKLRRDLMLLLNVKVKKNEAIEL